MMKAAIVIAALTGWTDYAEAVKQWERGTPMVVVLSADWCGPCQTLKAELATLKGVAVTVLDVDRDAIAKRFPRVESLPTIYVFRRWRRTVKVVGANAAEIREALRE